MPIEVMAKRGKRHNEIWTLKPVGLINPVTGKEDYAVVQLRQDNEEGTLYNIVGFQTRLKFPEQKRVFRLIPALKMLNLQDMELCTEILILTPLGCWMPLTD